MSLPGKQSSTVSTQTSDALNYQNKILVDVSRTFALTIPELPEGLRDVVANAYLLCRIADTIEDEAELSVDIKQHYQEFFVATLAQKANADEFARQLTPLLSKATSPAEHDLIANTPKVLQITHNFSNAQQNALFRCVKVMGDGMSRYQEGVDLNGLPEQRDLDDYCYYVAGVVGEMLTELFCLHDEKINQHRTRLMQLASSFGQALQMTNILKDVWDDQQRGVCWWPKAVFDKHGIDLSQLAAEQSKPGFQAALNELIAITHGHIRNALEYTLLIPRQHTGIRQFCLWALGLAMLTLRNIHATPEYRDGSEVKVPRARVKQVIVLSRLSVRSNTVLKGWYKLLANGMPLQAIKQIHVPQQSFQQCGSLQDFQPKLNTEPVILQQQFG